MRDIDQPTAEADVLRDALLDADLILSLHGQAGTLTDFINATVRAQKVIQIALAATKPAPMEDV